MDTATPTGTTVECTGCRGRWTSEGEPPAECPDCGTPTLVVVAVGVPV
jgi:rRNA maturation endonuclease Nob1